MSALAIFSELSERGITVKPNGQNVTVSPKDALTPDLVKRIKIEKPALLRELEKVRREVVTTGMRSPVIQGSLKRSTN